MPQRSSSIRRICAAAVAHFAERGYDAASLNEIAGAVGIRKASLYAHFASKDALYLEAFADALHIEQDFARHCFESESKSAQPGSRYCSSLEGRYDASDHLRFVLRAAYFPPAGIREQVSIGYQTYLDQLFDMFTDKLRTKPETRSLNEQDIQQFGQAYLGIVDSLHVELLYAGGSAFGVRLKALQRLLADSLENTSKRIHGEAT